MNKSDLDRTAECIDHLNFTEEVCPDCKLQVDAHGNTEDSFEYCCYPDCGCDGARLCMAGEPNFASVCLNREKSTYHTEEQNND